MHSQKVCKSQGGVYKFWRTIVLCSVSDQAPRSKVERPTLPPFFAKNSCWSGYAFHFPEALDQFSHILITMSVKGECCEIEYYSDWGGGAFRTPPPSGKIVITPTPNKLWRSNFLTFSKIYLGIIWYNYHGHVINHVSMATSFWHRFWKI